MSTNDDPRPALNSARVHRAGVRAAADDLERAIALAGTGRSASWATGVTEALTKLRDSFEHHIAVTEADNGLFTEVIEAAPRLAHRAEGLRREHVAIREAITQALADLKNMSDDRLDEMRETIVAILGQVVRHRSRGAEMVYEAWSVDIEAAD